MTAVVTRGVAGLKSVADLPVIQVRRTQNVVVRAFTRLSARDGRRAARRRARSLHARVR